MRILEDWILQVYVVLQRSVHEWFGVVQLHRGSLNTFGSIKLLYLLALEDFPLLFPKFVRRIIGRPLFLVAALNRRAHCLVVEFLEPQYHAALDGWHHLLAEFLSHILIYFHYTSLMFI